jgi:hypothetical protein
MGLPLSLKKLTRGQLQPYIDKIADQLPGWKADLLTKPGRKILVQFVMIGMMIYLAMGYGSRYTSLGFEGRGQNMAVRKDVKGGHCQVTWGKVYRRMGMGGLEISSLKELGWTLRMRWLWMAKTDPT